jgi:hypothetical protein
VAKNRLPILAAPVVALVVMIKSEEMRDLLLD